MERKIQMEKQKKKDSIPKSSVNRFSAAFELALICFVHVVQETTAALPRNVPRKVIGAIRRKGEKHRAKSNLENGAKRRIGMHAYSYGITLQRLHRYVLGNRRKQLGSGFSFEENRFQLSGECLIILYILT